MAPTFLLINALLLVISIIFNALHFRTIHNFKPKLNAISGARLVSPSCLLLMSAIIFPVDSYIISYLQNSNVKLINTLQEAGEVFQIGIYFGVNLVEAITKFRVYRTVGQARTMLTKKSVLLPSCLVALAALLGSISVFVCDTLNPPTTSLSGVGTAGFAFELTFYHACGILPVLSVYLIFTKQALEYYRKATAKAPAPLRSKRITPQRKQLISITKYVVLYYMTLICSWSPYLALKILCFTSTNLSTVQLYKTLISSSKLMMFALNPIANGMLQKRERQQLMSIISNLFQSSKDKFFNISSGLFNISSDTRETCSDQMSDHAPADNKFLQKYDSRCQRENDQITPDNCNVTMLCMEDKKCSFSQSVACTTDLIRNQSVCSQRRSTDCTSDALITHYQNYNVYPLVLHLKHE